MATEDPNLKRNAEHFIEHAVPIGYGGRRLSHVEHALDIVTSKLFSYTQLEPPYSVAAGTAFQNTLMLHNLMRWRIWLDLPRMQDLNNEDLFLVHGAAFKQGAGVAIGGWDRVNRLLQEVQEGAYEIPTRGKHGASVVGLDELAAHMGIAHLRVLPANAYGHLLRAVGERHRLGPKSEAWLSRLDRAAPERQAEVSLSTLTNFLQVWQHLWANRAVMKHDPIGYNPFQDQSPRQRATEFLVEADEGRTGSIPSAQACFLIDRALRWVFEYAPAILETLKCLRAVPGNVPNRAQRKLVVEVLANFQLSGPGAPERIARDGFFRTSNANGQAESVTSFREVAFDLLPTACAILIATFSARRKEEINSLQHDCVVRDAEGEPWLVTWIEKLLQDIDRIPIPECVVRAVEVLVELGEHAREARGEKWLFLFKGPLREDPVHYQFDEALKHFADVVGVPPLENGNFWTFKPHQFRRFFAIVYYHRFRYRSLTALSAFLKHFNPGVTRRYVTEAAKGALARLREEAEAAMQRHAEAKAARASAERLSALKASADAYKRAAAFTKQRAADFDEGRIDAEFERCFAVATGAEQMLGPRGEWCKRQLEEMILDARRNVELEPERGLSEEKVFNKLLYQFVGAHAFEPVPNGYCYCGCGSDASELRRAACLIEKAAAVGPEVLETATAPDHAYATPDVCGGCAWTIQMSENRSMLEEQIIVHLRQAQRPVSEHFSQAHMAQAERIRQFLAKCTDEARPMSVTLRRRPRA
ncbi:hypothetical protein [Roseicella sp. DB1501]|uniref:hypothetical protein n=1 Tax=Roseicella sp. DB1501 TaxID=2730925 RepID=UPI001490DFA4|nr:hypothetical protein [Roseicella sp. DB1501]NOG71964.1 hypothetical protein [Roseicella sp. DB1501]